jgi:hypothetical protein
VLAVRSLAVRVLAVRVLLTKVLVLKVLAVRVLVLMELMVRVLVVKLLMLEVLMLEMLLVRMLTVRLLLEGIELIWSGHWGGSENFFLVSVVVDCLRHSWEVIEEHCADLCFDTFFSLHWRKSCAARIQRKGYSIGLLADQDRG